MKTKNSQHQFVVKNPPATIDKMRALLVAGVAHHFEMFHLIRPSSALTNSASKVYFGRK